MPHHYYILFHVQPGVRVLRPFVSALGPHSCTHHCNMIFKDTAPNENTKYHLSMTLFFYTSDNFSLVPILFPEFAYRTDKFNDVPDSLRAHCRGTFQGTPTLNDQLGIEIVNAGKAIARISTLFQLGPNYGVGCQA